MPCPSAIFSRGVVAAMITRSLEKRKPCESPVRSRAAKSKVSEPASPVSTEAATPSSTPEMSMRLRPSRSPSTPAGSCMLV